MASTKNTDTDTGTKAAQNVFSELIVKEKAKPPTKQKYIETPEIMWQHFCDYRASIRDNPLLKIEQKKGTVILPRGINEDFVINDIVALPLMRPLTLEGFENYVEDIGVITDLSHYFSNKDNRYAAYVAVCLRIRRTIKQDQIEGGMAGVYNASITQRLNGLSDKSQVEVISEQPLFPDAD